MSEYIVDDELVQGIINEAYRKGKGGVEIWTQREWRQEPVVRCKGCKYFVTLSDDSKPTLLVCDLDGHVIDEQHFCGWGKPREGSEK